MIVERIREARAAADVARNTKRAILSATGLGNTRFERAVVLGCAADPVAEAARLRERLQEKLVLQEQYAAECHARMMDELSKIPSAVTRRIFLCRHYDGCKWSVVARRAGLGVQAAKMRHQRYLEAERAGHAA